VNPDSHAEVGLDPPCVRLRHTAASRGIADAEQVPDSADGEGEGSGVAGAEAAGDVIGVGTDGMAGAPAPPPPTFAGLWPFRRHGGIETAATCTSDRSGG
jgi:hypothetical protein